jgi:hypothetical protein
VHGRGGGVKLQQGPRSPEQCGMNRRSYAKTWTPMDVGSGIVEERIWVDKFGIYWRR